MVGIQSCILTFLIGAGLAQGVFFNTKKKQVSQKQLMLKTTHKPLYGEPAPTRKKYPQLDQYLPYRSRLTDYKYSEYYYDDRLYQDLVKEGSSDQLSVNTVDKRSDKGGAESLVTEETYKEGSDSEKYGFIGDKDSEGLYIQNQAGHPFIDKQQRGQILDDPYRFDGVGVFQSNTIVQEPKLIKNCDKEKDADYYCVKLNDGSYFDPWNPWCGYIECRQQKSTRKTCRKGTWMGLSNLIRFTTKDMCRRVLPAGLNVSEEKECAERTDYELCKNADQDTQNSTISAS